MSMTGEAGIINMSEKKKSNDETNVRVIKEEQRNELSAELKENVIELTGQKGGHKIYLRIELPPENETVEMKNCIANPMDNLELEASRRQQQLLAESILELQAENKQTMSDLIKVREELEERIDEVEQVKEENNILRRNLKNYQESLDTCQATENEITQPPSPTKVKTRKNAFSKNVSRMSTKAKFSNTSSKYSKKDISGPNTDSFVHVSGVQMKGSEMKIIDNSGLIDLRLRKFLAIAGLSEEILKDPSQLAVIEKFAEEEHILEKMDECKHIPAPPPPPPPPPPLQTSNSSTPSLTRSTPPRSPGELNVPNINLEGAEKEDMMSLIRNKTYKLNRIQSQDLRDWKEERKLETNELLGALRGALTKIGDAAGHSTDDDFIEEENKDDW